MGTRKDDLWVNRTLGISYIHCEIPGISSCGLSVWGGQDVDDDEGGICEQEVLAWVQVFSTWCELSNKPITGPDHLRLCAASSASCLEAFQPSISFWSSFMRVSMKDWSLVLDLSVSEAALTFASPTESSLSSFSLSDLLSEDPWWSFHQSNMAASLGEMFNSICAQGCGGYRWYWEILSRRWSRCRASTNSEKGVLFCFIEHTFQAKSCCHHFSSQWVQTLPMKSLNKRANKRSCCDWYQSENRGSSNE